MSGEPALMIRGLRVAFGGRTVLHDVSLDIAPGETLVVVGRSGSGKSTLVQALAGLLPPAAAWSAQEYRIARKGAAPLDLHAGGEEAFRLVRGRAIGVVFQEPEASLDPLMRVGSQIEEVFRFGGGPQRRVVDLLRSVGLEPPDRFRRSYPCQLSGGENQRVCIAAAIALKPAVLLADEPTSALDAGVEAGILDLLRALTGGKALATLVVTHDFDVVEAVADRVAVLADGSIVEVGPVGEVLAGGHHEATRELLAARLGAGPS